jgi:hypothetical protein
VLEGLRLWKKDTVYRDLYRFWSKIFAVNFAIGVVSGLVMAYRHQLELFLGLCRASPARFSPTVLTASGSRNAQSERLRMP